MGKFCCQTPPFKRFITRFCVCAGYLYIENISLFYVSFLNHNASMREGRKSFLV
jgi:hypothetical protein